MISSSYRNFFYTSEGVRIFFTTNFRPEELKNNEMVVIFNNGLACNINHYKSQIGHLDKMGFKVLFHDYRFHYSSGRTNDFKDCNFSNIVNDMTQLLKSLGIKIAFISATAWESI